MTLFALASHLPLTGFGPPFIQLSLLDLYDRNTVTNLSHYPVLLSSLFGLEVICQCNADKQNKNVQFWMLSLLGI